MGPSFFIDRPIFSAVISIVIVLGGAVSMSATPISQFPEIAPPTVTVSATYPGASAEVVANTVAAPIEQEVNGVDNMIYMSSTSASSGNMSLTVTFEPGTDPDIAQVNTQNRVNQALAKLPTVVAAQGITTQKVSQSFMMVIAFSTPGGEMDEVELNNYVNLHVWDAVKRVPGANLSSVYPPPDVAMRVWLRPDRLAQLGITIPEVSDAVSGQNQAFGIGQIGQEPAPPGTVQNFPITTQGMLVKPEEFDQIILRASTADDSAIVRLGDVGRSELGSKSYNLKSQINGTEASFLVVYQQPGSNAIATSERVMALLEELKPGFPAGLEYSVVMDTSKFTAASIEKVIHTFFEAVVLVVLVVFLFLQSLRSTVIPIIAVPVAIVGAYSGIYLLDFSTNMLTLFGMILAIGLVVDDAIIVVEAVEHKMATKGLSPKQASKEAMQELTGALVAIVLVLSSVFLPVAFLSGMTGTLYKQFAVTIAIAMVLSGVVALTLSPALSAIILKPARHEKHGFFLWFERSFERLTEGYLVGVRWLIRHQLIGMALFAAVVVALVMLFRIIPGSFVPEEDQGYLLGISIQPDAASLQRTTAVGDSVSEILRKDPAVSGVGQMDGYSIIDQQFRTNAGMMFVPMKGFEERSEPGLSTFDVLGRSRSTLQSVDDGIAFLVNPPSIPGLGSTGGFEFYIQDTSGKGPLALQEVVKQYLDEAKKRGELSSVNSSFVASERQLYVELDRSRAELLQVPVESIYQTLQAYFGSLFVSQFTQNGRVWQVILQAEPEYRDDPDDFTNIYLRSTTGEQVPLTAVATLRWASGPNILPRFNGFTAAKLTGSAAAGYSSGQAIAAMESVAGEVLPAGFSYAWSGQAFQEKLAGGTSTIAFVFGLIMVFLILSAQYEMWSLPIGVMMAVPFAILGALLMTWGRGLENDVYFQVGLVTLVGLSAKNAILITEFALENYRKGMELADAAAEAARLRLRPIVMTSLAFILGCVPMAIATGPGANSLHAIGTGVIGGMLASTLVSSFFVPMFFVIVETLSSKLKGSAEQPATDAPPAQEETP
ncbi:efflux RND transporter permease subunit [Aestuariirhabdus litorea]|uniref:Efflux pump membrane transporter n=1 Tax=Aestuariirhabdus litorea TaxID=2528527 RepID=A0A3P3VNS6_9GAMM|nr:multidrug efflux RND transporter permease subunit [Aestuariirhabdus litorea]RRJ83997.1 multidrug efflux RND transporter permease subunit [Aestuariirhabdus litorea]RWW97217.1 multidrug efflux RND transporter permease subunit [Endozoicomonadaceae bacterium GTF-13]